jgi:hypothetical protein
MGSKLPLSEYFLHCRGSRRPAQDLIVVCVAPDPKPEDPTFDFNAEYPMRQADPSRKEVAYSLETQRRMPRITL